MCWWLQASGQLEEGLDFGPGAAAGGHIAVHVEPVRMDAGQMAGHGCLGAEGLGKKHCGDIWVTVFFQGEIGGSFVLHAAAPAVDVSRVRKRFE